MNIDLSSILGTSSSGSSYRASSANAETEETAALEELLEQLEEAAEEAATKRKNSGKQKRNNLKHR